MVRTDPRQESQDQPAPVQSSEKDTPLKQEPPPFLDKLGYAAHIYGLQTFIGPYLWVREWKEYFYPPDGGPNIIKRYEARPHLPIRIFFPKSYDQTSPATLPTLFTIHGGGFCIGHSRDDDEWNRRFANIHRTLVISLNYSKSPWHPFPTALHDVEALLLACLADVSLPIERAKRPNTTLSRTAILGFSAGGNLALAVSQLPSIRCHAQTPPAAALSVYGCLDLSVPPAEKLSNRPTKPSLPSPRGGKDAGSDHLAGLAPAFDWSYVPYGHDLRDPLLSPAFADKARLPPFVGVVAAELDMLAHESWRLACRLSRRRSGGLVPDRLSGDERERVCGRREVGRRRGALEDINNERFGFEESWDDDAGRGGVKWLLVPDVLHGFDNPHIRGLMGGEATIKDAEMKTRAYVEELGNWLRERVWGL